jgi:vacuolar protein sorting-associated protein 11
MKYARVLLEHCPAETTQIFTDYYTGLYHPKKVVETPKGTKSPEGTSSAIQNLTAFLPLPYMSTSGIGTPTSTAGQKATVSEAQVTLSEDEEPLLEYDIPKPRTAFSSFVDHPQEFMTFLEALIKHNDLKEADKIDLYTTLFEMYLDTAKGKKGDDRAEWEGKAKKLIEGHEVCNLLVGFDCSNMAIFQIPIDSSNVLLLSHLSNFRDGSTLVREQQGLRADIFRSYTSAKDTQGVIKALRKYGPEEPQLYLDALAYFASSPKILEEAGDELNAVLKKIDEDGLMAPLQVIQTLSNNNVVTMGMIKKYLSENIERERKEISNVSCISSPFLFSSNLP